VLPKCLCAILCYNDGDIIVDVIVHMLANHHVVVVWDHGSEDNTAKILDKYTSIERKRIERSVPPHERYPVVSQDILDNYQQYDWISWPDADEILEGPNRKKSYYEYVCDVFNSPYTYIQCNLYNYIFTNEDDPQIASPVQRIKRYSLRPNTAPIFRGWKNSVMEIRHFNHTSLAGEKYPLNFNLRHFPLRSWAQSSDRIYHSRAGIRRGDQSYHYENLKRSIAIWDQFTPAQFHFDDGSELNPDPIFDWTIIYGYPPSSPLYNDWVKRQIVT
jgi:hypothetical protein